MDVAKDTTVDRVNVISRVEELIARYCEKKIADAATIGPEYVQLWTEIRNYLAHGGKRIRPQLFSQLYLGYGGNDLDTILPVASAWELLHSSLLVHDDIVDRDLVRHGVKNIAGNYLNHYAKLPDHEASHYALSAALFAGDLLLIAAQEMITESNLPAEEKIEMIGYLHKAFFEVGGGEHIDVVSVLEDTDQANVDTVIRYKTSGYSFVLPMQSGASLASASTDELAKLQKLGELLGLIFQIGDDILGVFGDVPTSWMGCQPYGQSGSHQELREAAKGDG